MNFSNTTPFSIYVPINRYNTGILSSIFGVVGMIERVDLLPNGIQKCFERPLATTRHTKAFIHFKYLYNNKLSNDIFTTLERGEAYHWYYQSNQYFILLKNRNPVPSTILNIHQVVDNCRLIDEEVSELYMTVDSQRLEIDRLKDTVAELVEKNDRMLQEFMQVLAFVYTTEQRDRIFSAYNFMKFGEGCNTRYLLNQNDDGSDEYLRQHAKEWKYGEFAEPREEEEEFQEFESANDDDLSLSSSSMPSLIEDYNDELSSSENDEEDNPKDKKMTIDELSTSTTSSTSVSVSAIPVKERLRNSAELCGNN